MKNFIQELFKKSRRKEKQVFLLCNIVLLVTVMAGMWSAYNPDSGQLIFPPSVNANAISPDDSTNLSTEETVLTESTTTPNEEATIPTETTPTETTEVTESEDPYPIYHVVEQGDSWYSLSEEYFSTTDYAGAIAYINGREMTDYIFIGETIRIESKEFLDTAKTEIDMTEPGYYEDEVLSFLRGKYGYSYGNRPNPAIDITVGKDSNGRNHTGEVDTSTFEYVGEHKITGYDPYCTHCCSGTGLMASGVYAINGYSVAAGYPIGTTLYIEGYGFYVVEDKGVSGKHIDIAAPSHEACYALTNTSVRVYIVPNNN